MKRLLAILMSVLMVCTLAMPVSAEGSEIELTANTEMPLNEGAYYLNGDLDLSPSEVKDFSVNDDQDVVIDLRGNTLTLKSKVISLSNGANLTIKNGNIIANGFSSTANALFNINKSSSITLEGVNLTTDGSALFPSGDAATVNVVDSVITGGAYAVATNASSVENYDVVINLTNSTLTTETADNDNCAVMINVPGKLNINGCTITGDRQALLVRSGIAEVKNTTLINTGEYVQEKGGIDDIGENKWKDGNNVTSAAVVFGDHNNSGAYDKNEDGSKLTIVDTIISSNNSNVPAIYTHDNNDDQISSNDQRVIVLSGSNTSVTGSIKKDTTLDLEVSGGTYSEKLPEGVVDDQIVQATVGEGSAVLYAVGKTSIESTSKDNPNAKVTLTNVPAGTSLQLPEGTTVTNGTSTPATVNGIVVQANGTITTPVTQEKPRPTYRPSSPSKDLPSNTKECQKEFGDEYIWSDEYDACVIKFMIVDTSTK